MAQVEQEITRRLQALDNSQDAVQSTSNWFISMKDVAKEAVKLWFKEFRRAATKRKIAFLHLVNDIVQTGNTIAPQYSKLFEPVLPTAFKETAKIQRHSVRSSVAHLLIVWAVRRVYSKNFLRQLRFICQRAVAEADTPDASEDIKRNIIAASPFAFSFSTVIANAAQFGPESVAISQPKRRKMVGSQRTLSTTPSFAPAPSSSLKMPPDVPNSEHTRYSISAFREELARELQTESMPPPGTNEMVQLLIQLQSTASGDATTRKEIAQFPPEVSDAAKAVEIVSKASDDEKCLLVRRLIDRAEKLKTYNKSLEEEMNSREQFEFKLRAFHLQLKERLSQAEADFQELQNKLKHGFTLKQELTKHLSSLPDLQLLPDVTSGLDPLPTVSDLFG